MAVALCVTGCGDPAETGPTTTVRDSAGIRLVENAQPPEPGASDGARAGGSLDWTVGTEPLVRIGTAEGPEEQQLFNVQGATRLSDGTIAVLNAGTGEIRLYDSAGAFTGSAGGVGQGPEEFRNMSLVGTLPGDSLLIYDSRNTRFSVVSPDPAVARTFPPGSGLGRGALSAVGLFSGGRMVLHGPTILGDDVANRSGTVIQPRRPLLVLGPDGGLEAVIDTFDTRPQFFEMGATGISFTFVPFRDGPQLAAAGDALYVGTGDRFEIRRYDIDGTLAALIRLNAEPRPVTEVDIARNTETAVERADEDRRPALRSRFDAMTYPERMPAHGRILVDAEDHLWVERYRASGDEPRVWTVFDPDGRVLGAVEVPAGLFLFEIGEDYLLGSTSDDLDIRYVVAYPLARGTPPTG